MDSYGIELIHPLRQGRCPTALGKKGFLNRRWSVGVKLCWLNECSWADRGPDMEHRQYA
jgi:hypothetical protein